MARPLITTPAFTAKSRASATCRPALLIPSPETSDHVAVGLIAVFGKQARSEIDGRSDCRATDKRARRIEQRLGELLGVGFIADHRPIDDRPLLSIASPLDKG